MIGEIINCSYSFFAKIRKRTFDPQNDFFCEFIKLLSEKQITTNTKEQNSNNKKQKETKQKFDPNKLIVFLFGGSGTVPPLAGPFYIDLLNYLKKGTK